MSTLALLAVALGCAALVGRRVVARRAQEKVPALPVVDVRGQRVPLVPKGEPTIVMVSSRTCQWCKKALADLGRMAEGRPIPRLTLLTLEGADAGAPMLAKEKLAGARLVGPPGARERDEIIARYPGTPTFLTVDRNGRVLYTIPGYPVGPELLRLLNVMTGDVESP